MRGPQNLKPEIRNSKQIRNPNQETCNISTIGRFRGALAFPRNRICFGFRVSIFGFRAEGVLVLTRYANGSPLGLSRGAVGDARLTFMHTENAQGLLAAIF